MSNITKTCIKNTFIGHYFPALCIYQVTLMISKMFLIVMIKYILFTLLVDLFTLKYMIK